MAPPKKKAARQDTAKASADAANDGAAAPPSPAALQASPKPVLEAFKQFKRKQDAKQLEKLGEAVQAAPCASSHLLLAKAYVLRAVDIILRKAKPVSHGAEARMVGMPGPEWEKAEDALEEEVTALLTAGLQHAALGVPIAAPDAESVAPPRKEKAFRCLLLAGLLAGILRGRGSAQALVQRKPWVERLRKFTEIATRMAASSKGLSWVPAMEESPLAHRWPFELRGPRPVEDLMTQVLQELNFLLIKCGMTDDQAASVHRANADVSKLLPAVFGSSPVHDPEEPNRRVQERLSSWSLLPLELRMSLADKYGNELRGHDLGQTEAQRSSSSGGVDGWHGKISRDQAAKLAKQEERTVNLSKVSSKAEEARRKREAAEVEQRTAAATALAARLQERAGTAAEVLTARVAAAGDSWDAQLAALLASLRLSVGDIKKGLERAARDKERSEAESVVSRTALERLLSSQQLLYTWTPGLAAALAAPETGGRGVAALLGTGPTLVVDGAPHRCRQRVEEAVNSSMEELLPLIKRQIGDAALLEELVASACPQRLLTNIPALELSRCQNLVHQPVADVGTQFSPSTPLPEDLQLLALAQSDRHLASLYEPLAYDFAARLPQGSYAPESARAAAAELGSEVPAEDGGGTELAAFAMGVAQATIEQQQEETGDQQEAGQALEGRGPLPLSSMLGEYFAHTWANFVSLTDHLVAWERDEALPDAPPDPSYGFSADVVNLARAFLMGHHILVLLEAAEKGERPVGWQWWHYKLLSHVNLSDNIASILAAYQADKKTAVAVASALDAFNRWFVPAHMALHHWLYTPPPPQLPASNRQELQEGGGMPASLLDGSSMAAAPEGSTAVLASGGAATAVRTAESMAVSGVGDMPPASGYCPGEGKLCGEPPVFSPAAMPDMMADWVLRGIAAVSLAMTPVPADVAAAAAEEAAAAAATGESSGDGGIEPPRPAAAWALCQKRSLGARILRALVHMEEGGALAVPIMEYILDFVAASLPPEGVQAAKAMDAARGAAISERGLPAAGLEQQALEQSREQEKVHGGEAQQTVTPTALLAHLPYLPLASLHELLGFLCIHLSNRAPGMHNVQKARQAGDEELMAACLQLFNASGRPASGGRQPGASPPEVAITEAGLLWALLNLQVQGDKGLPFSPTHFKAKNVPVEDIVAQLAAMGQPLNNTDSVGQTCGADSSTEAGPETGATASAAEVESGEGGDHSAQGISHEPATAASHPLPAYLRLLPDTQSWQPPVTLLEQLRFVASLSPQAPAVHGSGGKPMLSIAMQSASKMAAKIRLASFYMSVLSEVHTITGRMVERLVEATDDANTGLRALSLWVDKFVPGLPLAPPRGCLDRLEAVPRLLAEASAASLHASMCQDGAMYKQSQNILADSQRQLLVARARLAATCSKQEHQRCQAWVDDLVALEHSQQQNLDHLHDIRRQAEAQAADGIAQAKVAVQEASEAVQQMMEARRAGSLAAAQHRDETLAEAGKTAMQRVMWLEQTLYEHANALEDRQRMINLMCEQLYFKLHNNLGVLLSEYCYLNVRQRILMDLLQCLLPAAWQVERSALQAANEQKELLLEEDKERERQRQEKADRREAERKAKAKKAMKAAAVGAGGKAAGKMDWREQLDEVDGAGSEQDEANGDEVVDGEAMALSPEQRRNLERLYEEVGIEDGGGQDGGEWQHAGSAPRPASRQRETASQCGGRGSAQKPVLLSVPRRRPGPGESPAMAAPRRPVSKSLGDNAGVASGAVTTGNGWSFDDSWGQPATAPQATSWAQRASQGGDEDDVDKLMAKMGIHGSGEVVVDEEDADLAAAIAASLAPQASSPALAGGAGASASSDAAVPAQHGTAMKLAVLQNDVGQYNCFLNVIVQCLWHCREFRQQVGQWPSDFVAADPVVSALHGLFRAFQEQQQEEEEERRQQERPLASAGSSGSLHASSVPPSPARPAPVKAAPGTASARHMPGMPAPPSPQQAPPDGAPGRGRAAVDPSALRVALGNLEGYNFGVGEMHDPAEVLLRLYEKVMEAAATAGRTAGIEPTFGVAVNEEVHCSQCSKTTHQTGYMQFFYHTQATTLQMKPLVLEPDASMGNLLRCAEAQQQKSCDEDLGGCGSPNPVNHFLEGTPPRVFTLQVAWESHSEGPDVIASTLAALDEEVDLGEVYQGVQPGLFRYRLRSMVCYYGQHYQAMVLVPDAGGWLMFDDSRVSGVGGWADVRHKCKAGRIQPSVLFYEAVQG